MGIFKKILNRENRKNERKINDILEVVKDAMENSLPYVDVWKYHNSGWTKLTRDHSKSAPWDEEAEEIYQMLINKGLETNCFFVSRETFGTDSFAPKRRFIRVWFY